MDGQLNKPVSQGILSASMLRTVIYTVGHILIACACVIIITGSNPLLATITSVVEPLINAFWYYVVDFFRNIFPTIVRAIVYTIGHMCIAVVCIVLITGSDPQLASIDAVVEPLLNAVWFYVLNIVWSSCFGAD